MINFKNIISEKIEKEGYSAFSSTNKVSDNNERE